MKRVATAVVLIPLVLWAVLKSPIWLLTLLVGVVAFLTVAEYLGLGNLLQLNPLRKTTYGVTVLWFICLSVYGRWHELSVGPQGQVFWPAFEATIIVLLVPVFLAVSLRGPQRHFESGIFSVTSIAYIVWSLSLIPALRALNDAWYILLLLFVVWGGDIAALYVGKAVGRHKLAPTISPGKTWEGSIASLFAAIGIAFLFVAADRHAWRGALSRFHPASHSWAPLWNWLLLAAVINIAAQFGDLVESALKRSAGVKDSGTLLPGHGGILDRVDALLFALPVVWLHMAYFAMIGV